MRNNRNYSKELDKIVLQNRKEGKVPSLLLHACCAPCSSACLERLIKDFHVTVYYYNPNITEQEEYEKRKAEEKRLIEEMNRKEEGYPIKILEAPYDPETFLSMAKGLEDVPEGGERCFGCYALRLKKTAEAAKDGGYDCFTTTLTISPLKNADKLNEIGEALSPNFLPSDFKKKDGYLRSIQLSKEYGLYRQNYCGCKFSRGGEENKE